jgi:DNA-binding response OmpR family regulator
MRRRHNILCVDADGFGLQLRRLVLETAGHRVFAFTRTDEALQLLSNYHVEAVMLDDTLEEQHPGTARTIRELQPATPILLLSNHLYPPASARPFIDTFLTKGDAPEALLAEIESMIKRSAHTHPKLRPILWAGGAVVTGAAWFAARALRKRFQLRKVVQMKKPPTTEKPQFAAKSARA